LQSEVKDFQVDQGKRRARRVAAEATVMHAIERDTAMDLRRILGMVGSSILILGVFAPVVRFPIVGEMTYFKNGEGDGTIILILGVVSLILVFANKFRLLLATGGLSFAILLYTFYTLQVKIAEIRESMVRDLEGNPFAGLARGMMEGIQLQWGWALLVVGAGLVMAASLLQAQANRVKCPHCSEMILADAKICKHCKSNMSSSSEALQRIVENKANGKYSDDEYVVMEEIINGATPPLDRENCDSDNSLNNTSKLGYIGAAFLLLIIIVLFAIQADEPGPGLEPEPYPVPVLHEEPVPVLHEEEPSNDLRTTSQSDGVKSAKAESVQATPTTVDGLTGQQRNAVRSAKQYLSISGFSRSGLIDQLSSDAGDGYSVLDATAAVDYLNVDWNEQAVRSAKQYLSISGFSCKGLIEQLSSSAGDRYTVSQATYGARQAGACE